jgi:predicted dehydrogenase
MSSGDALTVGVIGCGEIAQLMHLPFLYELADFRIGAVCDLSASTVEAVGNRFGVRDRFTDYRELLACDGLDAVVVCTYDHAEVVRAALQAGQHVLVEKPLGFTPGEVADLDKLAADRGLVAMVGYMKLFDPGFEAGLDVISSLKEIRSVQVHDFAGRFDRHDALYTTFIGDDVDPRIIQAGRSAVAERIKAALGTSQTDLLDLYLLVLMLGSHDLAVLRTALGAPERVAFARAISASQLLAVLDFPGNVPCVLEIGTGYRYEWWDEWIAVNDREREVRVEFAYPYFRYAPSVLRIKEPHGGAPSELVSPVSPDSPFRRELLHFAECVRDGLAPRSTLTGAAADIKLAVDLVTTAGAGR